MKEGGRRFPPQGRAAALMAFSPWQILSPVQWAKWTWSAVRGAGAGEEEAGGPEGDPEEEEDSQAETKSLSFRQVHRIPAEMPARAPSSPTPRVLLLCARLRVCVCGGGGSPGPPAVPPESSGVLRLPSVLSVPCLGL